MGPKAVRVRPCLLDDIDKAPCREAIGIQRGALDPGRLFAWRSRRVWKNEIGRILQQRRVVPQGHEVGAKAQGANLPGCAGGFGRC